MNGTMETGPGLVERSGAAPGRPGVGRLGTVRALALAFAILAAGLAGVASQAGQGVEAAGPCTPRAGLYYDSHNGYRTVYGWGDASCSYPGYQELTVILKVNGTEVSRLHYGGYTTSYLQASSHEYYCYPGARYQAVFVHQFGTSSSYWTTGTPRVMC